MPCDMKQTCYIYFQNRIYRVYTSLYALQADTESLFEYMRAFGLSGIESNDYSP